MNESQILSVFQEPASEPPVAVPAQALVFDACHVGVVLRAVLFVETAVGVGAVFGALPATLVWLIAACSLKKQLARQSTAVQQVAGVALGMVAGLYGCAVLFIAGLLESAPWVACAFSGAMLSAALVAALVLRAKGKTPAATTARLTELQARIRPHFLFNTLNSAIALVRAEPRKAEALLEDLSDLFRHALMEQGESVTLADEIALARVLDPKADEAKLPPLLLQPLVENAVLHGVEPSDSGAHLKITTRRRGSSVVIKVSNTVPAGPGKPGNGLALGNVRDRLSLLHDVQGQFQYALKDGVFQVRIEVPL